MNLTRCDKKLWKVARSMEYAVNLNTTFDRDVKDDVIFEWEATEIGKKFRTKAKSFRCG